MRAERLKQAQLDAEPCAECGKPIDYELPYNRRKPDPGYPTVNHRVPLDHGGDAFNIDNMEPMHFSCNASRGSRVSATAAPSRDW